MPRRPRNRGIQRKHETIGLNENQLDHLINGSTWFFKGGPEFPFRDENHREQCWHRHKKEIIGMMIDDDPGGFYPRLLVGQRPEAFFEYENVPERKVKVEKIQPGNRTFPDGPWYEISTTQPTPNYLDEHNLWLPGEKQRYVKMVEREQTLMKKLSNVQELDEWRELDETVRKAREEYED